MELEETQTKKTFGAKILSKLAMIISSIWIFALTILKGLGKINLTENEIVISGFAISAVWTPTFISIIADKITSKI